jgi:hypothetical protein
VSDALKIKSHTSTAPKPYLTGKQLTSTGANMIDPSLPLEALDANRVRMSAADENSIGGPQHIRERVAAQNKREQDAFAAKWNIVTSKR